MTIHTARQPNKKHLRCAYNNRCKAFWGVSSFSFSALFVVFRTMCTICFWIRKRNSVWFQWNYINVTDWQPVFLDKIEHTVRPLFLFLSLSSTVPLLFNIWIIRLSLFVTQKQTTEADSNFFFQLFYKSQCTIITKETFHLISCENFDKIYSPICYDKWQS